MVVALLLSDLLAEFFSFTSTCLLLTLIYLGGGAERPHYLILRIAPKLIFLSTSILFLTIIYGDFKPLLKFLFW